MLFGWQFLYIDRPNYIPRRNPRVFIKKPQRKLLSSDALKIKTLSRDNQWPIRVQCNARFGAPARFQSIWYGFNANVFNPYIPWGMNELSALHSQPTRTNSDGPITGQEKPFALEIVHDRFELKNKINTPLHQLDSGREKSCNYCTLMVIYK